MGSLDLRRVGIAVSVLAGALGVLSWMANRGSAPFPSPAEGEPGLLALQVRALEARGELARTDALHLVLDPARATLTLFRGGAPLRSYPVSSVEAGSRGLALPRRDEPNGSREGSVWRDGRVTPEARRERRVIVADSVVGEPDPAAGDAWIPPTPEEQVPTPRRFTLRFGTELDVEILPERGPVFPGSRRAEAGGLRPPDLLPFPLSGRHVIRIVLPSEHAGALYRALSGSAVAFVVHPPSGR